MSKKYEQASKISQLNKVPPGYAVKPSKHLAVKGIVSNGLYSLNALPKDHVIGRYRGKVLTLAEALKKKNNRSYMFDVKVKKKVVHVIDAGNKKTSSFVRFANAADTDDQQNTKFVQKGTEVFLVSLERIPKNTELLTWYGKQTVDVIDQK